MPSPLLAFQDLVVNRAVAVCRNSLKAIESEPGLASLDERELERRMVALGADVGAVALQAALEAACERATAADLEARGLKRDDVRWRREPEYHATVRTTVGEIPVWTWSYRHRNACGGWTTRTPALGTVIARRRTRSSTLTLEWESKVAALHPYRQSAELLRYFSAGKLTVEDNTIARHVVAIASMMKTEWKYLPPAEIAEILRSKATCDQQTGRPLLYFSCDAHTLRQYEDDTWSAPWKNVNGLRLWCQDRKTGGIIHIGGDFTVGDCKDVVELVEELAQLGVLPRDLTYHCATKPDENELPPVQAQLVVVTDGAKWLQKRLEPALPPALWLLDAYHAYEYLNYYAATLYGKGTTATKRFYAMLISHLTGSQPSTHRPRKPARTWRRKHPKRRAQIDFAQLRADGYGIDRLIDFLSAYQVDKRHQATHDAFIERLEANKARMDYLGARARGMQIGSGAMESLHRTGSQLRLKLPGARWRPVAAQALLNLRALELSGRWDEFWSHDGLAQLLDDALGLHRVRSKNEEGEVALQMAA